MICKGGMRTEGRAEDSPHRPGVPNNANEFGATADLCTALVPTGRCQKDVLGWVRALVIDKDVDVVAYLLIEKVAGPLPLCPVVLA